jgi:hypothetical protein
VTPRAAKSAVATVAAISSTGGTRSCVAVAVGGSAAAADLALSMAEGVAAGALHFAAKPHIKIAPIATAEKPRSKSQDQLPASFRKALVPDLRRRRSPHSESPSYWRVGRLRGRDWPVTARFRDQASTVGAPAARAGYVAIFCL